jgi:hypothetical protein
MVFLFIAILAILLANYRTTVLALIPLISLVGVSVIKDFFPSRIRASAIIVSIMVGVIGSFYLLNNLPARYAEIAVFLSETDIEISDPQSLTVEERRMFSGRIFLWSLYIDDYLNGDVINRLIGFGPGTYNVRSHLIMHAHNNYIFDLNQIGIMGLLALILMQLNVIRIAMFLEDRHYGQTLVAAQIGLMIICLATTPFNNIDGLICYGLMLGMALGLGRGRVYGDTSSSRLLKPSS